MSGTNVGIRTPKLKASAGAGGNSRVISKRVSKLAPKLQDSLKDELLKSRIGELRLFQESLKSDLLIGQVRSDDYQELFSSIIDLAVNEYRVKQSALAVALGYSAPQVSRWASGRNLPSQSSTRATVIKTIYEMMGERISSIEDGLRNKREGA